MTSVWFDTNSCQIKAHLSSTEILIKMNRKCFKNMLLYLIFKFLSTLVSFLLAVSERRDSLLGSPDVIDTAPRRKQRQRTAKPDRTGSKMAFYQTELPAKEK